jgi:exosortase
LTWFIPTKPAAEVSQSAVSPGDKNAREHLLQEALTSPTELRIPVLRAPAGSLLRKHGLLTLGVTLVLMLYARPLGSLIQDWLHNQDASYGILVPPIAGYIAYTQRFVTLSRPKGVDFRGLILIALACLFFLVGQLGSEFFTTRLSLVILLTGVTWTFWGYARLRSLAFPIVLLTTMIPIPVVLYNRLAVPLQLFASDAATSLIQLSGGSVYRDGNIVQLPNVTLGVAEACSGLHSLSTLAVISLVFAQLELVSVCWRVCLILLSLPVAIAVNVVRVTGTAFLANYNVDYALGFYHTFAGWLSFVVGLAAIWLIAKILRCFDHRAASR